MLTALPLNRPTLLLTACVALTSLSCTKTATVATTLSPDELYADAKQSYLAGRYSKANDSAGQFLVAAADDHRATEARRIRAQSRLQLGHYGGAVGDFQAILKSSQSAELRAYAALGLGHAMFAQSRYREALDYYRQADEQAAGAGDDCLVSVRDEFLFASGVCMQNVGRWREAEDRLFTVWKKHPKSKWAAAAERRVFHNAFSVQLGAYSSMARAEKQRAAVSARGLAARVQMHRNRKGRPMYAVMTGYYNTLADALRARTTVASRLGLSARDLSVSTTQRASR